jgi:hypothetical protein
LDLNLIYKARGDEIRRVIRDRKKKRRREGEESDKRERGGDRDER